jgi:hypothetical protein
MPATTARPARKRFVSKTRRRIGFFLLALILGALGVTLFLTTVSESYRDVVAPYGDYSPRRSEVEQLRREMHQDAQINWSYLLVAGSVLCMGIWIFYPARVRDESADHA